MNNTSSSQLKNPFVIPFIIILIFALIEFFGGIWTQSLALLGDAWHMFSDAFALGLAMFASHRVAQASGGNQKVEITVSIINTILISAVIIWIVLEAIERMSYPRQVTGGYVMGIAFIGLVINVIVALQLHHHDGEKGLNHQAAFLHVIGDLLGSVAALAAGLIIYLTGWLLIDPILSIFISLLLLFGVFNLIKNIWFVVNGKVISASHDHHH
ncbi:MAG: cation transporter [Methylophilaceae bacterium]|jgi:cobalt-zinc-cadmium efflux system protein|nr:MAG: cation transporter [Methylophilaceae bacterium]